MKPLLIDIDTNLALLHLTPAEAKAPVQITQEYCDDYTPGTCRAFLDGLVTNALIYDDSYNNAARRERLLLWKDRTIRFIEAGFAQQQIVLDDPNIVQFPAVTPHP